MFLSFEPYFLLWVFNICEYVFECVRLSLWVNKEVIFKKKSSSKTNMVCGWKLLHDEVIKWKHFPRNWPFVRRIHRSPVNSPHKGQWRGALMFSLICVWINGWVNNREAGDLRRYRNHYDVMVMVTNKLNYALSLVNFKRSRSIPPVITLLLLFLHYSEMAWFSSLKNVSSQAWNFCILRVYLNALGLL